MGAFNSWVKGSFLEDPAQPATVAQIARNLLEGAAVVTRAQQLRTYGAPCRRSRVRLPPSRPLRRPLYLRTGFTGAYGHVIPFCRGTRCALPPAYQSRP
jgi:hypothetical protein